MQSESSSHSFKKGSTKAMMSLKIGWIIKESVRDDSHKTKNAKIYKNSYIGELTLVLRI